MRMVQVEFGDGTTVALGIFVPPRRKRLALGLMRGNVCDIVATFPHRRAAESFSKAVKDMTSGMLDIPVEEPK